MPTAAYWEPVPLFRGETVFLIGGGPSLRKRAGIDEKEKNRDRIYEAVSDSLAPIHDRAVIGINSAYRLGNWVNVLAFGDQAWWQKWRKDIAERYTGIVVTSWANLNVGFGFAKVMKRVNRGFYRDGLSLGWNACTGNMAINLAVQLGATRVVLIGYDGGVSGSWANWHNDNPQSFRPHPPKDQENVNARYLRFLASARDVVKGCDRERVEVIAAEPTAYRFWETVPFEDATNGF